MFPFVYLVLPTIVWFIKSSAVFRKCGFQGLLLGVYKSSVKCRIVSFFIFIVHLRNVVWRRDQHLIKLTNGIWIFPHNASYSSVELAWDPHWQDDNLCAKPLFICDRRPAYCYDQYFLKSSWVVTSEKRWWIMLGYLSLDIICSEKRTVSRERSSREAVSFEEQIMSMAWTNVRASFRTKWRLLCLLSYI